MILAASTGAAQLLLELGAILFGLAVLGRIATRVGIPSIPLYLLAGLAIGEGGIVQVLTAEEFIETGAEIGVVLLLLLLGLEYTGSELTDALRDHAPAGAVDLALNFTPGAVLGIVLGWDVHGVLLLGGITYISSSGIVARVLADLGNTGNRETPAVLAILVTEDLVMAVYLPLMAGLLVGGNPFDITIQVAIAVSAVVVALGLAIRYGDRMSALLFSRSNENLMLSMLGLTLLVAGFAESLGASAAVGAFLVGIALSGPVAHAARDLLHPVRDLFAALFFAFFGLQIDPASLRPLLPIAVGLAVVTAGTKIATGYWSAEQAGVDRPGRIRAGTTLVARGEFSIVIAEIAVAEGVEADLGPLAAGYVLILAVAGPLLARAADPFNRTLARRRRARAPAP